MRLPRFRHRPTDYDWLRRENDLLSVEVTAWRSLAERLADQWVAARRSESLPTADPTVVGEPYILPPKEPRC
jgi:hypothetical protein